MFSWVTLLDRVSSVWKWCGATRTPRGSTKRCLGHNLWWWLRWHWSRSRLLFPRIRVIHSCCVHVQGAAKSTPPKFFVVFSATVQNFKLKLYRFIDWNVLHLTANKIWFCYKNDEVINFLTWLTKLAYRFFNIKNVRAKSAIQCSKTGYHVTANNVTETFW